MLVLLDVEGVLTAESQKLPRASESPIGRVLYQHLREAKAPIVLLSEERTERLVKDWLIKENFGNYARLLIRQESSLEPDEWRVEAVRKLVASGSHIAYYYSSNPRVVGALSGQGISCFLFVEGSGRPGKGELEVPYRQWDDLVDIMDDRKMREAQILHALEKEEAQ